MKKFNLPLPRFPNFPSNGSIYRREREGGGKKFSSTISTSPLSSLTHTVTLNGTTFTCVNAPAQRQRVFYPRERKKTETGNKCFLRVINLFLRDRPDSRGPVEIASGMTINPGIDFLKF